MRRDRADIVADILKFIRDREIPPNCTNIIYGVNLNHTVFRETYEPIVLEKGLATKTGVHFFITPLGRQYIEAHAALRIVLPLDLEEE